MIMLRKKPIVKEKLFAHIETTRPYTFIWCGLVSLVGACLAFNDIPPIRITILASIIPMMGWIAGLYLSDFIDRDLDMIEKPHRPIPSGRIKPWEAIFIGAVFALSGFFLSFLLGFLNILLVFPVAILVVSYAKVTKSLGIIGNINRGAVIVIAYFFGIFSVQVDLSTLPLGLWLLPISFLIHDTNSNLVGTIRDVYGDRKGGYYTVPVRYGIKKTFMIALSLSFTYVSIIVALVIFCHIVIYIERFVIVFLFSVGILVFMYSSIFLSKKEFDRKKALRAHEFFIAERITLASAFLFGIVSDVLIPLFIFIIGLSVSLFTQILLRKRYEFKE